MKSVDEPESPSFSPDGTTVAFSALRGGIGDIFTVDLDDAGSRQPHRRRLRRLRRRPTRPTASSSSTTRASAATRSCSGSISTPRRRRSSPSARTTRAAAQFIDDHTIVFSSTATDPTVPLEPEVARNGNIYNIWTLDLNNGELKQYTDALGGNVVAGRAATTASANRIAFVTYYKGDYGIHTLERKEPLHTAATRRLRRARADHRLPGAADRTRWSPTNNREEGHVREDVPRGTAAGERRRHQQRRRLRRHADQLRRRARRQAVQPVRRVDRAVPDAVAVATSNLSRRFQFALQGFSQTQFFYGAARAASSTIRRSRRSSAATTPSRRARSAAAAPSASTRSTGTAASSCRPASSNLNEQYNDPKRSGCSSTRTSRQSLRQDVFRNGTLVPFGVAFVQETTVFREFGPLAGSTMRLAYDVAPKIGGTLSRQTVRRRRPLLPAARRPAACSRLRVRGFKSIGDYPDFLYFGGNSEMRGYDYLQFVGQNVVVRQRRAALPDHRGGADADRRHRRHPRRVLRQHRRRLVQPAFDRRPARARAARSSVHQQPVTAAGHRLRTDASASIPTRPIPVPI